MMYLKKNWWKFIQIHQYYTVALIVMKYGKQITNLFMCSILADQGHFIS